MHNLDPDQETEATISSEVRSTLRMLMWAMGAHLNIFDKHGNECLGVYIPFLKIVRDHPVEKRLQMNTASRSIDKAFLDTVFIDKDEFEYWHLIEDWPVPAFWFRGDEIEYHNENRDEAFRRSKPHDSNSIELSAVCDVEILVASTPKQQQRLAAVTKHAERNRICTDFFGSLDGLPPPKELNSIAIKFYEALPETKKLELARSPSEYRKANPAIRTANGVRTLIRFVKAQLPTKN